MLVNKTVKTVIFWAVIIMAGLLLWQVVRIAAEQHSPLISYSEFRSQAEAGNVSAVRISRDEMFGTYRNGDSFRLVPPPSQEAMLQLLREKNVEIWFRSSSNESRPMQLLGTWAPLILLACLWLFMIRSMQKSQRARAQAQNNPPFTGNFPPATPVT